MKKTDLSENRKAARGFNKGIHFVNGNTDQAKFQHRIFNSRAFLIYKPLAIEVVQGSIENDRLFSLGKFQ